MAPVWGVGKIPWVLEFVKLDTLRNVPLLPAPTEEGGWTNRATSAQEAKKWRLSVLSRALNKDPEMKSVALSWAGKAGLSAETRQILGHNIPAGLINKGAKGIHLCEEPGCFKPVESPMAGLFQDSRSAKLLH